VVGEAARNVLKEGQAMLERIVKGRWLTASGVFGLWPANSVGDDIEIYADETRERVLMTWHNLRQQNEKPAGNPNQCLADFVAPKDSGVADYVGAFAVTAGIGIDAKVKEFEAKNDDYSAIMLKALADRLAEAFAEHLHHRVRTEFWGYAADETLANDELIAEKYRGIRPRPAIPPAPTTPRRPSSSAARRRQERRHHAHRSFAMLPDRGGERLLPLAPAVALLRVGKIERDQVADYAHRKGMDLAQVERWLAPILNY
jgi:5-methyltetrahydrofolate--homocysteine methyltransferase